jgi:hypothetical protein
VWPAGRLFFLTTSGDMCSVAMVIVALAASLTPQLQLVAGSRNHGLVTGIYRRRRVYIALEAAWWNRSCSQTDGTRAKSRCGFKDQ